jgi:hypothetical protein
MINIGRVLPLHTTVQVLKAGQGNSSKSRIVLGELRKELHSFVLAGRKLMPCGLVVNLM